MIFGCKDCGQDFPTAKEFVDHIPECKPENLRLLLTHALREAAGGLLVGPNAREIAEEILKQFKVTKR
jgi:hypothetical protein